MNSNTPPAPQDEQLSELMRKQSLRKPLRLVVVVYAVLALVAIIGLPRLHNKQPFDLTRAVHVDLVAATGDLSAASNKVREKKPVIPDAKPKADSSKNPQANPEKPPSAVKSDAAEKRDVPKPKEELPKPAPKKTEAPKKDATRPEPAKKQALPDKDKKPEPKKEEPKKSKDDGTQSAEEQKEFNSLLKNLLGDVDPQATTPDGNPFDAPVDPDTKAQGQAPVTSETLSLGEMDALKYQLARCWNIPSGAMNAENLVVDLRIEVNPDRTVRAADIIDQQRYHRDSFFQAAADSARRAVFNPLCNPLALPADKYELWKIILIRFNPREMFGG